MKAVPQGYTKDQRNTSKVLGRSRCAVNGDCYIKCIMHTESLHGMGLRIKVNLISDYNITKLETWGSRREKGNVLPSHAICC